jgi:hypothetical protein
VYIYVWPPVKKLKPRGGSVHQDRSAFCEPTIASDMITAESECPGVTEVASPTHLQGIGGSRNPDATEGERDWTRLSDGWSSKFLEVFYQNSTLYKKAWALD